MRVNYNLMVLLYPVAVRRRPSAPPVSAAAPPSILTRPSHPPTFVMTNALESLRTKAKTEGEGGASPSRDSRMTLTLRLVF